MCAWAAAMCVDQPSACAMWRRRATACRRLVLPMVWWPRAVARCVAPAWMCAMSPRRAMAARISAHRTSTRVRRPTTCAAVSMERVTCRRRAVALVRAVRAMCATPAVPPSVARRREHVMRPSCALQLARVHRTVRGTAASCVAQRWMSVTKPRCVRMRTMPTVLPTPSSRPARYAALLLVFVMRRRLVMAFHSHVRPIFAWQQTLFADPASVCAIQRNLAMAAQVFALPTVGRRRPLSAGSQ
jgi:hypothetical protein